MGAYGMEWVHNREPERTRVTSHNNSKVMDEMAGLVLDINQNI